jgi:hypothetical protein
LVDISIPSDRNVIQNEAEKKTQNSSYRNSTNVEYEMLYHTVVTGIAEAVIKGLRNIRKQCQKTAVIGASYTKKELLQSEYCNLSGRVHDWLKGLSIRKKTVIREIIIFFT